MLDELRDRVTTYLSKQQVCVISTTGPEGARAILARYRSRGLEVDCLLPRWTDVAYHLEQDPRVTLVIQDTDAPDLCWLRYLGTAHPVENPDWAEWSPPHASRITLHASRITPDLYLVARVTPRQIDLLDESQGWGARETIEF
jgi:hypothetical protein